LVDGGNGNEVGADEIGDVFLILLSSSPPSTFYLLPSFSSSCPSGLIASFLLMTDGFLYYVVK
jgi:hypothetical protein